MRNRQVDSKAKREREMSITQTDGDTVKEIIRYGRSVYPYNGEMSVPSGWHVGSH